MKYKTAPELIAALELSLGIELDDPTDGNEFRDRDWQTHDGWEIEEIAQEGGEGCGDEYFIVFSVFDHSDDTRYLVEFDGCYSSWSDTEWGDAPYFVQPVEKLIVVYEPLGIPA